MNGVMYLNSKMMSSFASFGKGISKISSDRVCRRQKIGAPRGFEVVMWGRFLRVEGSMDKRVEWKKRRASSALPRREEKEGFVKR